MNRVELDELLRAVELLKTNVRKLECEFPTGVAPTLRTIARLSASISASAKALEKRERQPPR
jgi:hypothetical protein